MKNFKSHFKFNKQERSGIFFLLLIILVLQGLHLYYKNLPYSPTETRVLVDDVLQRVVDSLKKESLTTNTPVFRRYNPNFISDYKGYMLGLTPEEIDRLHKFRMGGSYVNSVEEFQQVTLVSDSLLQALKPFFKFPKWKSVPKRTASKISTGQSESYPKSIGRGPWPKDINTASVEELRVVNGIGDKLSKRIVKFRDRLGGFLVSDQLYDVYGLDSVVVKRALAKFEVRTAPSIQQININTASVAKISKLVYITYSVAERIVNYRNNVGTISNFDELMQIEDFPSNKIDRIKLYLSL
ncbi:ComEA family DNA-binding protein [Spongiimicrobium sp. 3-5]|uniref:ComEA family DNA-binding protein n=1 Tax=Spongiimicrobium sp. 3-5 TaxID=3332596 RepID=UPI00397FA08F